MIIFGPADEIREIITQRLHELDLNYETHNDLVALNNKAKNPAAETLIITWREEEEKTLTVSPHAVNIMKLL